MSFEVNMKDILEIVMIVLTLKIIVSRWKPPVQESLQAIICIVLGTALGFLLNRTTDGLMIGIITSSVSFYGKTLFTEFTELKSELEDVGIDITYKTK